MLTMFLLLNFASNSPCLRRQFGLQKFVTFLHNQSIFCVPKNHSKADEMNHCLVCRIICNPTKPVIQLNGRCYSQNLSHHDKRTQTYQNLAFSSGVCEYTICKLSKYYLQITSKFYAKSGHMQLFC